MKPNDDYSEIRSYLDLVLAPWTPLMPTNGSHKEMNRLYRVIGPQTFNNLISRYFDQMGDNGQRDPHNKFNEA